MHTSQSHPTVGIVGGGIGGLTAAAFLQQAGFDVTVYEQAPALTEVGAGLIMAPNAVKLLRKLGAFTHATKQRGSFEGLAVQLEVGWEFRRWQSGDVISREDLTSRCKELYGEHTYAVHRAALLDVIKAAVDPASIRLDAKVARIDAEAARPTLTLVSGETFTHDVIIGADGVHSVVRDAVTEPSTPTYSGMCAFRALVPITKAPEFAKRRAQVLWLGPEHHFVHYPVSSGDFVNVVAFAPAGNYATESWTATATREEFLAEFVGWDARVAELINSAEKIGRWALLDRAPLERWTSGSVALLGDAAHAMFPFFAQGAAQSMEDAAVLALTLQQANGDFPAALRRYEQIRLPRTTQMQQLSHGRADANHLPDGPEQADRDRALGSADPLMGNGWIYGYEPERAVAEAHSPV